MCTFLQTIVDNEQVLMIDPGVGSGGTVLAGGVRVQETLSVAGMDIASKFTTVDTDMDTLRSDIKACRDDLDEGTITTKAMQASIDKLIETVAALTASLKAVADKDLDDRVATLESIPPAR